jgi:hypothetical protein
MSRRAQIDVNPKYPASVNGLGGDIVDDPRLPPSTPADALVLKLARTMLGWSTTMLQSRLGVTQSQRQDMEAGRASGAVKAKVFQGLREQRVPIAGLSRLAEAFLGAQHSPK